MATSRVIVSLVCAGRRASVFLFVVIETPLNPDVVAAMTDIRL